MTISELGAVSAELELRAAELELRTAELDLRAAELELRTAPGAPGLGVRRAWLGAENSLLVVLSS